MRDTAYSHDRLFIIEVMGRDAGFIALRAGIAAGAEDILIPETITYIDDLLHKLEHDWRKNKTSGIIIVAEGDDSGGAFEVIKKINEKFDYFKTRVTILGHIQRGGSPEAFDRILASRLGCDAVEALLNGYQDAMVGIVRDESKITPYKKATMRDKKNVLLDEKLYKLTRMLAT